MRILDNRSGDRIGDILMRGATANASISMVCSQISVFFLSEISKSWRKVSKVRILLPDIKENCVKCMTDIPSERKFRNTLGTRQAANELYKWVLENCEIKASRLPINQNLYHVKNLEGKSLAIHGSSTLTAEGMGIVAPSSFMLNSLCEQDDETQPLLDWFESLWQNSSSSYDYKSSFLEGLRQLYQDYSPTLPYYLTLSALFERTHGDLDEDRIIKSKTGIKDKDVWKKLYRFQNDGVLGAIDKIECYNGCIIADSVGLGKTFEALAIIKYYELRNDRVLVLCSKKLKDNWTIYTVNDKRNLLLADRFNYDVLCFSDLTRTKGHSGEINLETVNWGNYDLVVIDESHNFRNNPPRRNGLTRYSRLMREIIQSGVKTKVLMLSATPVNSRMNDLKNQVAFINAGLDDALYDVGIASIEQTLKQAQTKFNTWLRLDDTMRTTQSLLSTLNYDYFKLLDTLTIARSRKHITKYYNDSELGEFPKRFAPINIKADIDRQGEFPTLREINRDIRKLHLSAYAPLKYVLPSKLDEYERKYDLQLSQGSVFRQIDREESLIHLMRVNLFKRMESSIHAFAITVENLLNAVRSILDKIEKHEDTDFEELDIEKLEIESEEFTPYLIGNKIKVLIKDVDKIKWKQELQEDEKRLTKLLRESRMVVAVRDAKLFELKRIISAKINNPINDSNLKVLIFTAFADTATYLYSNLAEWALKKLGIHSALVTGSDENKTNIPKIRKDLSTILTNFSPISKERDKINPDLKDEIDLLIGTDCISEGQNLQDCDYVVNYDIHWNPVRIIQRFGRIDRLGSRNSVIQLVNFWPNMELEEYINLESRVSGRMVLLDISATGEENIIEYSDAGKMNDLEYRRKQLEQLQHQVLDLEDLGGSISITDMTFNEFRTDLAEYSKQGEKILKNSHLGLMAVVKIDDLTSDNIEPGVIFCLKTDSLTPTTASMFAMEPYYLAYVTDSGKLKHEVNQVKQVVDDFRSLTLGRAQADPDAMRIFNQKTNNGKDMSLYENLLAKAISAISGSTEEQGVESLFHRGGTLPASKSFKGMADFEVVTYLVVV
jgi:ERCC4-related helicase